MRGVSVRLALGPGEAASRLFTFAGFRSAARGRLLQFLLRQFGLIKSNSRTDEISQGRRIDLVTFEKIDRSPHFAFEARVEDLVGIWQRRPMSKGDLHLLFVGVGDRDDTVVGPHWASHPFPFLDDLSVGLEDALAQAGECFAAPVGEFCDQLVNTVRWFHGFFLTPGQAICDRFSLYLLWE